MLISKYYSLPKINDLFTDDITNLDFSPFFVEQWKKSLLGPVAIQNCMWIVVFDKCLSEMPKNKLGIFLWENQSWEQAFLYAWYKYSHGRILAVPTSTIRFWAINLFEYEKQISEKKYSKYVASEYTINGPVFYKNMLNSGYSEEKLLKTEASRYKKLNTIKQKQKKSNDNIKNILVLGDYDYRQTLNMLDLIRKVEIVTEQNLNITLKPHPSSHFTKNSYPDLNYHVTQKNILDLARENDLVFTSNSTSACIDIIYMGSPLVIYLDPEDLNQNPLSDIYDDLYISDANDFIEKIDAFECQNDIKPEDIFWFTDNDTLWNKVIDTI